ncbi:MULTISPECIES: pyridoxamine 5'-phosphate oxidase family protein [Leptospira]|uniref:Pyridoxamine 5'-phosphate oxidase family protein n=3 Tax=Leptospira TaxID=171 RepID=T0FUP3_9LEPT|nr:MULTISPECIES: pyridoxamine 5'-phosphate oxidase family protein [Leptospira]EKO15745.1 pyridoxamine 5'-phosphate oxidase family protein [Leptospira kirschneri str. H1]EKO60588.1 pyridoxamine 5'-phosphate oxidase family protein [Leptospira kirschneri str. H2]EMO53494.1 pyridoxamine 5'-phosphate oxidase family protein [Leptospira noguchii]EQA73225.1 pyridoxamine 5'-phosphate oxidase family protein [Leptospira noguchii serovar Panama str. CZ214]MCH1913539.1 pyridoxamine 5'-phosphate oxidase fam
MIPEELQPCLQGIVPSIMVTCSKDGIPNATIVSQVYQVDSDHLAISNQFFGKTHKNVTENKYAIIQVLNPENLEPWLIDIYYKRTETEGELFDAMEMQLEAIASMSGMSDVFKLKAADIFEIRSVRKFTEAKES